MRITSIETLFRDMRVGARMLARNPGFAVAAIVTLALGIGANAAIFSVIDAVLLRPLPFKDPGRIVLMSESNPEKGVVKAGISYPDYSEWARQSKTFEQMAAYWNVPGDGVVFGGSGSPERLRFSIVTSSFFSLLGVQPARGRGFQASDEKPGAAKVFLASDALWKRSLGGDPEAIGKTYRLDGESYTLIGVMPPSFQFPPDCDVWAPMGVLTARNLADRISHPFWVLGRLHKGATLAKGQAEIDALQGRLAQAYPVTDSNWRVRTRFLIDEFVGNIRLSLLLIAGAVAVVLLIACANVVNLMLVRASARAKEFAVRAALGAERSRLIRQTLAEAFLIVILSSAAALIAANWALAAIATLSAGSIARLDAFHLNWQVLVFAAGVALVATVLIGLAPALQVSASGPADALRSGQRGGTSNPASARLRKMLTVVEVALTLVLLSGAGLLLRSFARLSEVNPGFRPDHLSTVRISLPDAAYPRAAQRAAFLDQLMGRIKTLSGVESFAVTSRLPLIGERDWDSINIVGRPLLDWAHGQSVEMSSVSADYFRTVGIALVSGRTFRDGDPSESRGVTIVNRAMAEKFWPGSSAIGQRVMALDEQPRSREIVGVVGNVKDFGLDLNDEPQMYTPATEQYWNSLNLVVRSNIDPANLLTAVRGEVAALDKEVPVYQAVSMDQVLSRSFAPRRFILFLVGLFALLALVLAAIGIYGLLAYGVSQRTQEIGLRMALGAQRESVLRDVMREGMTLVAAGLLIGAVASFVLSRTIADLLFEVNPSDPLTLVGVALVLAIVSAAACYIPARRATKVDPIAALRCE